MQITGFMGWLKIRQLPISDPFRIVELDLLEVSGDGYVLAFLKKLISIFQESQQKNQQQSRKKRQYESLILSDKK